MNEPVAFIDVTNRTLQWAKPTRWETPTVVKMDKVPLYVKKEWQGLTDEEARELCVANVPYVIDMVRALEAKLKEKNNG